MEEFGNPTHNSLSQTLQDTVTDLIRTPQAKLSRKEYNYALSKYELENPDSLAKLRAANAAIAGLSVIPVLYRKTYNIPYLTALGLYGGPSAILVNTLAHRQKALEHMGIKTNILGFNGKPLNSQGEQIMNMEKTAKATFMSLLTGSAVRKVDDLGKELARKVDTANSGPINKVKTFFHLNKDLEVALNNLERHEVLAKKTVGATRNARLIVGGTAAAGAGSYAYSKRKDDTRLQRNAEKIYRSGQQSAVSKILLDKDVPDSYKLKLLTQMQTGQTAQTVKTASVAGEFLRRNPNLVLSTLVGTGVGAAVPMFNNDVDLNVKNVASTAAVGALSGAFIGAALDIIKRYGMRPPVTPHTGNEVKIPIETYKV